MKKLFSILIVLVIVQSSKAQQLNVYRDFFATQVDEVVRIDFTLLSGTTCFGIHIYRSTDSLNFYEIGDIPGSCGSPSEPVSYAFIDRDPVPNVKQYYRLNFGGASWSGDVSILFLEIEKRQVQIRPNPMTQNGFLYFENNKNEVRYIEIRNQLGNLMSSYETESNSQFIDVSNWSSAIYWVLIYDDKQQLLSNEKLFVQN